MGWVMQEGEQEKEHVLWWSESQVDSLEGSEAFEDAVGLREQVNLAARVCTGLLGKSVRTAYRADQSKNLLDEWRADEDIERAVRGAFVSILTRAFYQDDESEEENRLVPLLDMLQHCPTPNVRHRLEVDDETGDEAIVVRAREKMPAGTELLNCYDDGEFADRPAKFLSRFGFVPGVAVGEFIESIQKPSIFYGAESYGVGGGKFKG